MENVQGKYPLCFIQYYIYNLNLILKIILYSLRNQTQISMLHTDNDPSCKYYKYESRSEEKYIIGANKYLSSLIIIIGAHNTKLYTYTRLHTITFKNKNPNNLSSLSHHIYNSCSNKFLDTENKFLNLIKCVCTTYSSYHYKILIKLHIPFISYLDKYTYDYF